MPPGLPAAVVEARMRENAREGRNYNPNILYGAAPRAARLPEGQNANRVDLV